MTFYEILNSEINMLKEHRISAAEAKSSPEYHLRKVSEMVNTTTKQLQDLNNLSADELKLEFISVMNQIPAFISSVWNSIDSDLREIDRQIAMWEHVLLRYSEWDNTSSTVQSSGEKEIITGEATNPIVSEETNEPPRRTSTARKAGTRPPITLGQYRKLTSKIESGEDPEA
jgi:hypothetical protein